MEMCFHVLRVESSVTDEFGNSDGALELAVLTVAISPVATKRLTQN
jgi:hypothetical protein